MNFHAQCNKTIPIELLASRNYIDRLFRECGDCEKLRRCRRNYEQYVGSIRGSREWKPL